MASDRILHGNEMVARSMIADICDADHDGMPDAWETRHGLDPKNPDDRNGDGYTNLEEYLNSLIPSAGPKP